MGVLICRSHSRAFFGAIGPTPGSAPLHPGLYAAARVRELRTDGLYSVARIPPSLRTLPYNTLLRPLLS